jgi:hypothetical protein
MTASDLSTRDRPLSDSRVRARRLFIVWLNGNRPFTRLTYGDANGAHLDCPIDPSGPEAIGDTTCSGSD